MIHLRDAAILGLMLASGAGTAVFNRHPVQAQSGGDQAVNTSALDCNVQSNVPSPNLPGMNSQVRMECSGSQRSMMTNSIPNHIVGNFPGPGNPNRISAQNNRFAMPLSARVVRDKGMPVNVPGYARNGIMLEPQTEEVFGGVGMGREGWRYEAIQTVYNLGLDMNLAHVQPTGNYHYHGLPAEYLKLLNQGEQMTLMAWASDGFPIYARYGYNNAMNAASGIKVVRPNFRLKTPEELQATRVNGQPRPGFDSGERRRNTEVGSLPLGVFVQDWVYDSNLGGDLDECNGRFGVTPEFPKGIYHYYITEAYPYMQRCIKGDGKEARTGPTGGMGGRPPPGMGGPQGGPPDGPPDGGRRPPPGG